MEEYDELIEIMFNVNFNNNFMVLVREVGSLYKLIFFGMIMDIYVFYIGNCLFLFYFLFLYFYC